MGELVLAWDATTRATSYYTVTAVMLHTDAAQVHLNVGGEHVETTPAHSFSTLERGWVAAGDLWDGAHVRRADGSYALTLVLWLDAEPQVMYNLTVATAHTFFVGVERALVHNAKCKITEVFYQKIGGSSDGWSKGFHLNTNDRKIEIMLKPEEVNGVIKISLIARGENARDAKITSAVVNSVRNLLQEDPDGGRALANSIITQYQHDERRGLYCQ